MNCERCGERPGVVRYTEYSEGGATRQLLCPECARALGLDVPTKGVESGAGEGPGVPPEESATTDPSGTGEAPSPLRADRRCPSCGMTGADFAREPLFGCPQCYGAFGEELDALLRRLHGAVTHRGRLPRSLSAVREDATSLRAELEEAVRQQDFERAARLRDRLRRAGHAGEGDGP